MKRKFLLTSPTTITGLPSAAVLLLAFVIPSLQASVTVLSQQSRIFGSWHVAGYFNSQGELTDPDPDSTPYESRGSFDVSSTFKLPLHYEGFIQNGDAIWEADTSSFNLSMDGRAENYAYLSGTLIFELSASTTTRFQPVGTRLTIHSNGGVSVSYDDGVGIWLRLRDLTTGESLLSIDDLYPDPFLGYSLQLFSFDVNPAHEYELDHGFYFIVYDNFVSATNQLLLTSVPEHGPGTGGVAIAALTGLVIWNRRLRQCAKQ